ncbi:thiamine-binding protein [Clostridium ganghwense]|uniref:Thiamine-binding protein n=1 Tax=Clostridium ganghwense TaxID=312089 RepID=A0ABT4CSV1_9CLOT|nr:thiamine-binding protein [Clostridium ganghwense]MCY6372003.1 thiamine-binding protein [Clostridium ganghwense]
MQNINVSLQILPVVEEERIYPVVDKVIEYIDSCDVKYEVGAMETTMEGDLDKLLEIVKKAQDICVNEGAARVISIVKIDYKPEGVTMNEKTYKYKK